MSSTKGETTFVELNWVSVTEADIAKVAELSNLPTERIQQYLGSDEQNNNILRHFAFIRVYPAGKLFR